MQSQYKRAGAAQNAEVCITFSGYRSHFRTFETCLSNVIQLNDMNMHFSFQLNRFLFLELRSVASIKIRFIVFGQEACMIKTIGYL